MSDDARSSWSRDAVIYEVYVRSFADGDGDGLGDLVGVASRLDYLAELGVDAIWLTPFYRSPMMDGGYDVADYRDVDPSLGTLADFDKLLDEAHARGLKLIIDLVPNHCSSEHPWFQAAQRAGPGSPERELFHFRRGLPSRTTPDDRRGGEAPPNNWQSIFHGPAWTRLPDGDWYLHLFAPEQPDFNWDHPAVRAEFADVLRFWLDRGVDGIRIDVAHGLVKAPGLPDAAGAGPVMLVGDRTPFFDQDGVHDIYREWRSILDTYAPERIAVAEAWLDDVHQMARYVRPGELHQSFNFEFLGAPWSGPQYRRVIDESLAAMDSVGAPTTWVLSNHDVVRHASRLAAGIGGNAGGASAGGGPAAVADPAVGLRARAAACILALPVRLPVPGQELTCRNLRPAGGVRRIDLAAPGAELGGTVQVPLRGRGRGAVWIRSDGSRRGSPTPAWSTVSAAQGGDPARPVALPARGCCGSTSGSSFGG
jgi:alpha-glucosidase